MTRPRTDVAPHLTGITNGRVEDLIRRAREDSRTALMSQAKLSRLARAIVNGNRDAVPASLRHMLAWADPTGESAAASATRCDPEGQLQRSTIGATLARKAVPRDGRP